MVRVVGFKPVGVERRSGSIPPSGRELLQLILVRNKELVRMVEEIFLQKSGFEAQNRYFAIWKKQLQADVGERLREAASLYCT